jgi:stearoyl-CoA desaturase (Delta-9 desaturase)
MADGTHAIATGPQASAAPLTVHHPRVHAAYRRDSLVIVVLPAVGALAAVAWAAAYGVTRLDLVLLVVAYSIASIGIDVGFHRHFAHRAFDTHPAVRLLLAIAGSAAAQGRVIRWVSNHRRHHAYSDRPDDPHSPHARPGAPRLGRWAGLWHAHTGWIFSHDPTNTVVFAKDILRDPVLAQVNRYYLVWLLLGLALPAVITGVLRGTLAGAVEGVLWGWALPVFLSQQAAFAVNSIGHYFGRRPFATDDESTNNPWLAIPSIGAGWQNNHHAFPSAARTQIAWWEIDLGWLFLRALAAFGLVWNLNRPTAAQIAARRRA